MALADKIRNFGATVVVDGLLALEDLFTAAQSAWEWAPIRAKVMKNAGRDMLYDHSSTVEDVLTEREKRIYERGFSLIRYSKEVPIYRTGFRYGLICAGVTEEEMDVDFDVMHAQHALGGDVFYQRKTTAP